VFAVAKIAGINAAKKNWELIPLCHQISLRMQMLMGKDSECGEE